MDVASTTALWTVLKTDASAQIYNAVSNLGPWIIGFLILGVGVGLVLSFARHPFRFR